MAKIEQDELIALQESIDRTESPPGVLRVMSGHELRAYRNGASVSEVIIPIRERIFENIALPPDFMSRDGIPNPILLGDVHIVRSDQIAVLCDSLEDIEGIKRWLLETLANHIGTTVAVVRGQISFALGRSGFGGPVVVCIMEDEREIADQL